MKTFDEFNEGIVSDAFIKLRDVRLNRMYNELKKLQRKGERLKYEPKKVIPIYKRVKNGASDALRLSQRMKHNYSHIADFEALEAVQKEIEDILKWADDGIYRMMINHEI